MKRTAYPTFFIFLAAGSLAASAFAESGDAPSGTGTSTGGSAGTSEVAPSSPTAAAQYDGILKQDGMVYFIKKGRPQKVDREMRLSEGITVQSDGDVILKDGTKITLKDGQMMTFDGQVISAPAGILNGGEASGTSGGK